MATTMLVVDKTTRKINLFTNPYWYKDGIYIGTRLNSNEEHAFDEDDIYFYKGSVRELVNEIRLIGNKSHFVKVSRPDKDYEIAMIVMNGYCVLSHNGNLYSRFIFFEDKVKIMENMVIRDGLYDGAYHITSKFTLNDKPYYQTHTPKGKSYDDIIAVLKTIGPSTSETISEYLDVDRNRVSGRLTEMERSGLVKRHGYSKSKFDKACIVWELA